MIKFFHNYFFKKARESFIFAICPRKKSDILNPHCIISIFVYTGTYQYFSRVRSFFKNIFSECDLFMTTRS